MADDNPESGAAIQLWDYAGAQWQQWTFVPVGADTYRICNRFTGKAIDLCLGGTADGTWLHQWDCNTGRGQQWKLEPTEDGYVRFRSVLAGKYLDLYQAFSGNGGRAQIWSDNEGTNQRWILKDVTDKNAIRPSAAQLEKRVKEQVEEAAQEAAKAAKKAARKAPAKKSAAKTTATRTCRAKKKQRRLPQQKQPPNPVAPARALQKATKPPNSRTVQAPDRMAGRFFRCLPRLKASAANVSTAKQLNPKKLFRRR